MGSGERRGWAVWLFAFSILLHTWLHVGCIRKSVRAIFRNEVGEGTGSRCEGRKVRPIYILFIFRLLCLTF